MTPEQLKQSILQDAMEGKLVKQDPNDEPASVLLEKIKAEKEQLIKEGKIKKSKRLPEISEDEKPFDIPDSWEWVRLGDIFNITSSKRVMKKEWQKDGIPFYRAREIVSLKNNRPLKDPIFINKRTYEEKLKVSGRPYPNDILVTGVGTLGVTYIVPSNKEFYFKDGNIIWLKNFANIYSKFIEQVIDSPYMKKFINNGRGTTVATLTIIRANSLIIPFPPLEEQKRIVEKIEKLMPLVDKYAEAYNKLQQLDGDIADKLKQSILQDAMEGKLVKQDPDDEPASVLLEKIKAEKEQLIKDGKIKKSKKLPEISDDEKPFDIPDSWEWVQLDSVASVKGGKRVPKGYKLHSSGKFPYIRVTDMESHSVNLNTLKFADSETEKQIHNYTISSEDLYFSIAGTIGKVGQVPQELDGALLTENAAKVIFINMELTHKKYIEYALSSPLVKQEHAEMLNQMAQPKLALIRLRTTYFPLPPLAEQKRIVAKIEKLFSSIDNSDLAKLK